MNSPKVEIRMDSFVQSKDKVIVGINEIPFPTAIYFLESKRVILNKLAYECMGLKVGETFDIESWKRNNNCRTDIKLFKICCSNIFPTYINWNVNYENGTQTN